MGSVNEVNSFFANMGRKLAEKSHDSSRALGTTLLANLQSEVISSCNSLVLLPTDEDEIRLLIDGLKESCAMGLDQIPGKIIKRYTCFLTSPITHICNLSLSTGIFPNAFKTALIKPKYKGGDRDCVNNYRPI